MDSVETIDEETTEERPIPPSAYRPEEDLYIPEIADAMADADDGALD